MYVFTLPFNITFIICVFFLRRDLLFVNFKYRLELPFLPHLLGRLNVPMSKVCRSGKQRVTVLFKPQSEYTKASSFLFCRGT